MKHVTVFVFLVFILVDDGIANGDSFDDDYVEDDLRNVNVDRVDLLRKYVYDEETRRDINDNALEKWAGRWMPERPNDPTPPPKVYPKYSFTNEVDDPGSTRDSHQTAVHDFHETVIHDIHGVAMGRPSITCDDAQTNLTVDWDRNPINHTCYDQRIVPDRNRLAIKYCEHIPKYYVAMHKCMYEKIEYRDNVPVIGSHRPLWAVFGEYKFLPRQRWLHNLEHGSIVMLYHPCANPLEVKRLKNLLRSCLRRYVITPYNLLDEDRPLTLVAWGCRLSMSYVDPEVVTEFIREHALRGPENISRDGQFVDGLIRPATIVSDIEDSVLCPHTSDV